MEKTTEGFQLKTNMIRNLQTGWLELGDSTESKNPRASSTSGHRAKIKPVLFFIHGFPDTPTVWQKQLDYFSKEYHCIAPYSRGIGPSLPASDTSRYSLDAIALDHLQIIRQTAGNSKVCVIGHDIGTLNAWHLARLLGSQLHSLVIINGASLDQFAQRFITTKQFFKSWYIVLFQLPVVSEWILKNFGKRFHISSEMLPFLEHYRKAFQEGFFQFLNPQKSEVRIPKNIPVLVLQGKDDPYVESPTYNELSRLSDNFNIRVFEAGHWTQKTHSQQINHYIESMLKN